MRHDCAPEAKAPLGGPGVLDDPNEPNEPNDPSDPNDPVNPDAALLAALRSDCPRAAVAYLNDMVTDRPSTIASCTFYRAGTLVLTRPDAAQELPRRIDAVAGADAERVVVSRKATADRTGNDYYDLVHVVDQPAVRVLFVHCSLASDEHVRAAAVSVVNEDVDTHVAVPAAFNAAVEGAAIEGAAIEGTVAPNFSSTADEFKVVVLEDNTEVPFGESPPGTRRCAIL